MGRKDREMKEKEAEDEGKEAGDKRKSRSCHFFAKKIYACEYKKGHLMKKYPRGTCLESRSNSGNNDPMLINIVHYQIRVQV